MSNRHTPGTLSWLTAGEIPDRFLPAPFPPRADRGQIGPLARSIRAIGCIHPILARPREGRLQVVCGYRRLLASQSVDASEIPVLVRDLTDEECRRLFAEENSYREPVREASSSEALPEPTRGSGPAAVAEASPTLRAAGGLPPLLERACAAGIVDRAAAESIAERFDTFDGQAAELRRIVQARKDAAFLPPATPQAVSSPAVAEPRAEPSADPALAFLLKRTEGFFRLVASTRAISVEEAEAIAGDLIALAPIRHGRDIRSFAAVGSIDWLPAHSLVVAGFGIHFAESLGWTPGQVKKFALACLLHDVGMLFVPRQVLLSPQPLGNAERRALERHPAAGRELIQNTQAWGAQIHLAAQDHHERWDGTGYPGSKKGKEVDLAARIVGFLDCLAALVTPRPHRPAMLYSEALRQLAQETAQGRHDPLILKHFRTIFTDLPVGACLRLKDGRLGRVIAADSRHPGRHRIRIVADGQSIGADDPVWIETAAPEITEILPAYATASPWSTELDVGGKTPEPKALAPRSSLS